MISARPGLRCLRATEDEPPVAVDEPSRTQVFGERRSAHGLSVDLRELDPPQPAVLDQRGERVDPPPVPARGEREQGPCAALEEHGGLAVREGRPLPGPLPGGQGRAAPYGWAGSAAGSARTDASREASRRSRIRSTAPGSANCAAPRPSTKYPRLTLPDSSSARSTPYTPAYPPGAPSARTASRVSTPCRSSSCIARACAVSVDDGAGSRSGATSDHLPAAAGGPARRGAAGRRPPLTPHPLGAPAQDAQSGAG